MSCASLGLFLVYIMWQVIPSLHKLLKEFLKCDMAQYLAGTPVHVNAKMFTVVFVVFVILRNWKLHILHQGNVHISNINYISTE